MLRLTRRTRGTGTCRRDRHLLDTPHLRLQTPALLGLWIATAAASDPEAQRWLGWPLDHLVRDPTRSRLLARKPGGGSPYCGVGSDQRLIAIDKETGLLAGSVGVDGRLGELGGWLAPRFRSRGLGTELFASAAEFAHRHLGMVMARAGAETTNTASIGALLSAGFIPTDGPETHQLPDGRVVPSRWFRHDADQPTRCPLGRIA